MDCAKLFRQISADSSFSVPGSIPFGVYVARRIECEGIVPLSRLLATAAKQVLSDLASTGRYEPAIPGFRLPLGDGKPDSAVGVLNLLTLFSKILGDQQAVGEFSPSPVEPDYLGWIERSANCLAFRGKTWEDVLPISQRDRLWLNRQVGQPRRIPCFKHGPGAVAEKGIIGWDKWLLLKDEKPTPPARMTSVPKDVFKRRIIGMEPVKKQFLQQGLASALRKTRLFSSHINLHDQFEHVRFAAENASSHATIDMSDASDSIPSALVEYLLPSWYPILAQCSSNYMSLPNGETYTIGMFANMGCGYCFEVETAIFLITAALTGKLYDERDGFRPNSLSQYIRQCRVYGDDIIMPRAWLPLFEAISAELGWTVNQKKTCRTPVFLETCGAYIVNGEIHERLCPSLLLDGTRKNSISWTDANLILFAERLERLGYVSTARWIIDDFALRIKRSTGRWKPTVFFNAEYQRLDIRVLAQRPHTRPLNVVDEQRWEAYWYSGCVYSGDTEETGRAQMAPGSYPVPDGCVGDRLIDHFYIP